MKGFWMRQSMVEPLRFLFYGLLDNSEIIPNYEYRQSPIQCFQYMKNTGLRTVFWERALCMVIRKGKSWWDIPHIGNTWIIQRKTFKDTEGRIRMYCHLRPYAEIASTSNMIAISFLSDDRTSLLSQRLSKLQHTVYSC